MGPAATEHSGKLLKSLYVWAGPVFASVCQAPDTSPDDMKVSKRNAIIFLYHVRGYRLKSYVDNSEYI
jgi:hypothetical protein